MNNKSLIEEKKNIKIKWNIKFNKYKKKKREICKYFLYSFSTIFKNNDMKLLLRIKKSIVLMNKILL